MNLGPTYYAMTIVLTPRVIILLLIYSWLAALGAINLIRWLV
jgi:hypothetical protein